MGYWSNIFAAKSTVVTVSDQTIEFGALTRNNAGGAKAVASDGSEVDITSVTGVSGASTGWSASGGRITRSSTPAAAVLSCVTSLGTIQVTISTIADAYSVLADATEIDAACDHLKTTYGGGKTLYIRPGTMTLGTDQPVFSYNVGSPRNYTSVVTLRSHSNTNRAKFTNTAAKTTSILRALTNLKFYQINWEALHDGGLTGWANMSAFLVNGPTDGLTFEDCEFFGHRTDYPAASFVSSIGDYYSGLLNFSFGTQAELDTGYTSSCLNGSVLIKNCTFRDSGKLLRLPGTNGGPNGSVIVEGCTFYNYGLDCITADGAQRNLIIRLNDMYGPWIDTGSGGHEDFIQLTNRSNCNIPFTSLVGTWTIGETVTGGTSGATATIIATSSARRDSGVIFAPANNISVIDVVGEFIRSETLTGGTSGATATSNLAVGTVVRARTDSGIKVYGNRMLSYRSNPQVNQKSGTQGAFIQSGGANYSSTEYQTGTEIIGNVYMAGDSTYTATGGDRANFLNGKIIANTGVRLAAYSGLIPNIPVGKVGGGTTATGSIVADNAVEVINGESDATLTNNRTSATTDRATIFDGPTFSPGTIAEMMAALAPKAGQDLVTATPKIGAVGTYITWNESDRLASTIDHPRVNEATFSAFTDATGASLSTVTTSNWVQVSSIKMYYPTTTDSVNGALVSVSGAASPQFRIADDGSGTNATAWGNTPAIVTQGKYVQVRATSSGSSATAVSTTVTVGAATDTWTVTTA